ncbi:MAG TPA: 16S rRNA (cytosine(1402)-N(4))-methyltransferase RsmH [Fimbriimonadaceae bacterium]|nr:16S rRNA (cytosine(1402)-N(4))-methyltransferase RsmH [Fimbriimonadaceae bacterium]
MVANCRNAAETVSGLSLRRMAMYRRLVCGPLMSEVELPEHLPVMVREILDVLRLRPGDTVVDGTLGLGGHTLEFLKMVTPGGHTFGFDWDKGMLNVAVARIGNNPVFQPINDDFRTMAIHLAELKGKVRGILLDLGLNSAQVDDPERGFSFRESGALDMRMDRTRGEPASALLNRWTPGQIEEVLQEFGDERWARAIAKQIVERRKASPLRTTQDLVDCVLAAIPPRARDKRIHPATRTFQSIRIATNSELDGLKEALVDAASLLEPEGTLAVLSYHSGEDRIVKNTFRELSGTGEFADVFRKPLEAGDQEVRENPRSRSAKLRALRKIDPKQDAEGNS